MTTTSATTEETSPNDQDDHPLVRLGRLGYAAKGIVYVVVGFLATKAAAGTGGEITDSGGALRVIEDSALGKLALVVITAGLFGYAAWRIVAAFTDAERRGDEPTSLVLRAGDALRGIAYGSLGYAALKLLTSDDPESTDRASSIANRVMEFPAGRWIVILGGLGIVGYALYQVYRAASGKFMKRLDLSSAGATARKVVERTGRFGIFARAVVFGVIGVLMARAGWTYDPEKAGGIEESLSAIARESNSRIIFGIIAAGLIAFGLFQLATARYRVMRAS